MCLANGHVQLVYHGRWLNNSVIRCMPGTLLLARCGRPFGKAAMAAKRLTCPAPRIDSDSKTSRPSDNFPAIRPSLCQG